MNHRLPNGENHDPLLIFFFFLVSLPHLPRLSPSLPHHTCLLPISPTLLPLFLTCSLSLFLSLSLSFSLSFFLSFFLFPAVITLPMTQSVCLSVHWLVRRSVIISKSVLRFTSNDHIGALVNFTHHLKIYFLLPPCACRKIV